MTSKPLRAVGKDLEALLDYLWSKEALYAV